MNASLKEVTELLVSRDQILILTHKNPDGDTLGSAAALCSCLRRAGKQAFLFPNPQITEKYTPFLSAYLAGADFVPNYVIAVDTATPELFSDGFGGHVDLCIDHHPTNSHYAEKELIWPERAACGEIILRIIEKLHGELTKEEADLLYIAVSTDTGCFQYANTNEATFSSAARLLKYGASNEELNLVFFRKVSRARLMLEGRIYSSMSFHREGKIVVATVTRSMIKECNATEDDCDDLAALPGRIEEAVVGITIREMEDGTSKISVRTSKEVSAIRICEAFGGGGHQQAAGCRIGANHERAKELLLAVVDEVYK